jgi:hypothetical protein
MKFNTQELINRIDVLIQARIDDADAKTQESAAAVEASREKWLKDYGPGFVVLADRIKEKIRKDRPIVADDLPPTIMDRYGSRIQYFSPERPRKYDAQLDDLKTLRATLEAVTDETITTTGLREIGFKNISDLFRTVTK